MASTLKRNLGVALIPYMNCTTQIIPTATGSTTVMTLDCRVERRYSPAVTLWFSPLTIQRTKGNSVLLHSA